MKNTNSNVSSSMLMCLIIYSSVTTTLITCSNIKEIVLYRFVLYVGFIVNTDY